MIMLRSCSYLQPWQQGPAVCPIQLCTNDTISEGVNHTAQTVCCLDTCRAGWCPSQCPDRQLRFLVHKCCSDEMMVGIMISGDTLDLVLPLWKMSELIFVWNTLVQWLANFLVLMSCGTPQKAERFQRGHLLRLSLQYQFSLHGREN